MQTDAYVLQINDQVIGVALSEDLARTWVSTTSSHLGLVDEETDQPSTGAGICTKNGSRYWMRVHYVKVSVLAQTEETA